MKQLSLMFNVVLCYMQTESRNLGHFVVFYFNAILDVSSNCVLRYALLLHASHWLCNILVLHSDWFFKFTMLILFRKVTRIMIKCFALTYLWRYRVETCLDKSPWRFRQSLVLQLHLFTTNLLIILIWIWISREWSTKGKLWYLHRQNLIIFSRWHLLDVIFGKRAAEISRLFVERLHITILGFCI